MGRHLSMEVFERAAALFPHLESLRLIGYGEALLHPHFFHMLETAARHSLAVAFHTNGRAFTRETYRRLAGVPGRVTVVFSHSPEAMARLEELNDARQANVELRVNYVLTKDAADSAPAIVGQAAALGACHVHFTNIIAYSEQGAAQSVYQLPAPALEDIFSRVREAAGQAGVGVRLPNLTPRRERCPCPWQEMFIRCDGGVYACNFHTYSVPEYAYWDGSGIAEGKAVIEPPYIGDLNETGLESLWNARAYRSLRHQFKCGRFRNTCGQCLVPAGAH